ncbi:MAG: tRNA-dihydrouridine synthase family protein [Oligoflexia bacterium]|nr:tRNA-dihydrouridine synthase family protein [Oligoflexia bacterium]
MFPASYQVRNIKIAPALGLAPMSGVTNVAFRRLIKELNPGAVGLVTTEFISVEAMTRQVERSFKMMRFYESERPFCVQIFGYDIKRMSDAARMVEASGADIVDINCGCPAPKVVKKGGGCELMRQPDHLQELLKAVRAAVKMPLTMKFRSGWDTNSQNAVDVAKMAEAEGVEAITIHGRTRVQLYRGVADYNVVRDAASQVKIPVVGSGDVVDRASAEERLAGGVAGLFVGRAAITNPLVFREIVSGNKLHWKRDEHLVLSIVKRYIELLSEDFEPRHVIGRLKQLVSQMCRGYDWSKTMCRASSLDQQLQIWESAREALEGREIQASSMSDIGQVLNNASS